MEGVDYLGNHSNAKNSSRNDVNVDVQEATGYILCVLSTSIFITATVFVLGNLKWKWNVLNSRNSAILFFLGVLLSTVTSLCVPTTEASIYSVYRMCLVNLYGVVFFIVGAKVLFQKPPGNYNVHSTPRYFATVGAHHGSMGMVIWVVTFPLIVLELCFAIGAATKQPHPLYSADEFMALAQKVVQATVYYFSLQHKIPRGNCIRPCSWYFLIISFFNFVFWIDSITTSSSDNDLVKNLFGDGFSIVKCAYNALLIDYRLLCCLLFLEHALEIKQREELDNHEHNDNTEMTEQYEDIVASFEYSHRYETSKWAGLGYMLGLGCIICQVINLLQYLDFVGSWANLTPAVAEILVAVCGCFLVFTNSVQHLSGKWRDTDSKAVDVMVGLMGAVGFVYWFIKSSFCVVWTVRYHNTENNEMFHYLVWTSIKNIFRACGVLFQLYLFVRVGPRFCLKPRNRLNSINHMLVPGIMLGLLSTFTSAVIDQFSGEVEHLINTAHLNEALLALFDAGAPLHLGFCLHMFLHFLIINHKMVSVTPSFGILNGHGRIPQTHLPHVNEQVRQRPVQEHGEPRSTVHATAVEGDGAEENEEQPLLKEVSVKKMTSKSPEKSNSTKFGSV